MSEQDRAEASLKTKLTREQLETLNKEMEGVFLLQGQ
jgi:hypothetical protein